MAATWVAPGNALWVGMGSSGYYYYCEGIETTSMHLVCNNLYYVAIGLQCAGGYRWGVIGQGTSHVNPWYNQPVNILVAEPEEFDGIWFATVGTYHGMVYCRTNFYSNGSYNNGCSLSVTS